MSKKKNDIEFNNEEATIESVSELPVEETGTKQSFKGRSFSEADETVEDEPSATDPEESTDESSVSFEDAGCRAFGDTVLKFPSLPNKEFLDYRAGVVINCFEHQPSVMEPVTVSK